MLARALVALLLASPGGDERDRVVLTSGKELRGRVLFVDDEQVVLRRNGRDQEFVRREVAELERIDARLDELLADARPSRLAQAAELEALAARATAAGLVDEARLFWWHLLVLDPESEAAHVGLGHRKQGASYGLPLDGRALPFARRSEAAREWSSAWELASLHYQVRSTLPLERTLELVLDLERLYRAFFEFLGPALALREVVTPMKIHLHAARASYPENAGEHGRYEPETDTVHVDASGGFELATLVHEATHQLLFVTAFKERGAHGEIPPWVNEGLAEYVAHGVVGAPPLAFQPGQPALHHFRVHAASRAPHDLARVLSFATTDYQAGDDTALKYAQSYSLVHFLLHGEDERHRAGFLAYLRLVYAGRGSATDLKKCLDADWKPLERAWNAYAQAQAL